MLMPGRHINDVERYSYYIFPMYHVYIVTTLGRRMCAIYGQHSDDEQMEMERDLLTI
jgi:hypothetical protein